MIAFDTDAFLRAALAEDLGAGDITSELTVAPDARAEGTLLAKTPLVVAGLAESLRVFTLLDPATELLLERADGDQVPAGTALATVRGNARTVLAGERLALNLLQHLCGIATLTRTFVDLIAGTQTRILDTRKTIPGLRILEKAAVKAGGGFNHRLRLDDGVLIKDNHIALAGGLEAAISRARRGNPGPLRIEVEVGSPEDAQRALAAGADMLLLDNMPPETLRIIVEGIARRIPLEASGGVNLDTVRAIAETGVDFISIGRLTHSAPAADINLKFRKLA